MRKCLATQEQLPKKELIRIVKNNQGEILIDETGRANGRGAYLKRSAEAVELAQAKHLLDRSLETDLSHAIGQTNRMVVAVLDAGFASKIAAGKVR